VELMLSQVDDIISPANLMQIQLIASWADVGVVSNKFI
jgi:hypothetical protein